MFFFSTCVLLGCVNNEDIIEPIDPDVQFEENIADITEFFEEKELSVVDTTTNGVRYSITSMAADTADTAKIGDIIVLEYVAYRLDGSLLGTNMQAVVDTTDLLSSPGDPIIITHSVSGWAFDELFNQVAGAYTTSGFRIGVTTVLNEGHNGIPDFRVGDRATLGVPARETTVIISGVFTRLGGIPNDVIIYEFSLTDVIR